MFVMVMLCEVFLMLVDYLSSFAHSARPGHKVEMMGWSQEGHNHWYFSSGLRNAMASKKSCCVHCCDVANQFNAILPHIWWPSGLLTCFRESKSESSGFKSIFVGGFRDIINHHQDSLKSLCFILFGDSRTSMDAVFCYRTLFPPKYLYVMMALAAGIQWL